TRRDTTRRTCRPREAAEAEVARPWTGRRSQERAILRLSADPAKEPSDERTEYQPGFGRERNVGGHAYKDAEHYPDQRADANKEPRSPSVFPDSHTDHPRLPRNSRSRTHKGSWCGLGCRGPGATERRALPRFPARGSGYASSARSPSPSFAQVRPTFATRADFTR